MGRRNRERIARIEAGEEEPISAQKLKGILNNPLARRAVKLASRKGVISKLSEGSTVDQIGRLDSMAGTGELPPGKLKSAITRKAPREMDKAIKKLQKQGKEITVDALCAEVKSTPGFLQMCNNVGITLAWFEELARERMKAHGVGA